MRTFAELLDEDLRARGLMQDEILHALVADDEPVVTSSAVSMWRRRNRVPPVRLKRMIDYFGPDSALAKAFASGEFKNEDRAPNNPESVQEKADRALGRAVNRRAVRDFAEVSDGATDMRWPDPRDDKDEYFTQRGTDILYWLGSALPEYRVGADIFDRRTPVDGEIFNPDGRRTAVFEVKDLASMMAGGARAWAHQLIGQAWCHKFVNENDTPILPLVIVYDTAVLRLRPYMRDRPVSLINVDYNLKKAAAEGLLLPHVELKYDIKEGVSTVDTRQVDRMRDAMSRLK